MAIRKNRGIRTQDKVKPKAPNLGGARNNLLIHIIRIPTIPAPIHKSSYLRE